MGKMIRLKAKDGHELDAYLAEPKGKPKGGIVVVQEIFGVTDHIKRVADQYAAQGYKAIAPAMFDRVERNVTLDYSQIQKGLEYMRQLKWPNTLADVEAAANEIRGAGSASVVGYCWGGTVAHVAASELDARRGRLVLRRRRRQDARQEAAVPDHVSLRRSGRVDSAARHREDQEARIPTSPLHVYPGAGHGFNCDERGSYSAKDAEARVRALDRVLERADSREQRALPHLRML